MKKNSIKKLIYYIYYNNKEQYVIVLLFSVFRPGQEFDDSLVFRLRLQENFEQKKIFLFTKLRSGLTLPVSYGFFYLDIYCMLQDKLSNKSFDIRNCFFQFKKQKEMGNEKNS